MSNYGAYVQGRRPASKKAINAALAAGETVRFDNTSAFGGCDLAATADAVVTSDGSTFRSATIVGPDPYTRRMFYGTLTINTKGKVVVK